MIRRLHQEIENIAGELNSRPLSESVRDSLSSKLEKLRSTLIEFETSSHLQDYSSIIEYSPIGIVKLTSDLRFILVNPAFSNFIGYTNSELMTMTVLDITHPDDRAQTLESKLNLSKAPNYVNRIEKRYIHKSGQTIWGIVNSQTYFQNGSDTPYIIATIEDTTQQRKTRWIESEDRRIIAKLLQVKTLHELSTILLQELAISTQSHLATLHIKCHMHGAFDSPYLELYGTYGYPISNIGKKIELGQGLIGQCAIDAKPKYITDISDEYIRIESSLGSIKPSHLVIMPIAYENEVQAVLETASLHKYSELQLGLINQIANNIGVRIKSLYDKTITDSLLKEIAITNKLLDHQKQALDSSAIVAETDVTGKINYVNEKFIEISKYNRLELMGQDHRIVNSRHHTKEFFQTLWKTIAKGAIWHGEVKNRAKDGSYYWVDTTIYPVTNDKGKPEKYVAIRFDITDKKRVLDELTIATQRATQAAKAKADFLANMSHEIRTPMNAIIGMADLLSKTRLSSEQVKLVGTFQRAGDHLLQVINDVLDISKIEAEQIKLELSDFDMNSLIKEITELFQYSSLQKHIVFKSKCTLRNTSVFKGDPFRIKQIITNLLGNSFKFTKTGMVSLTVEPNCIPERKGNLLFKVLDTGIGFSSEVGIHLFKPFSQGDTSTTRQHGGTGLGLSISKAFVEMMGGEIWFESVPEKGTIFYFTLTLAPSHITKIQTQSAFDPSKKKISNITLIAGVTQSNMKVTAKALKFLKLPSRIVKSANELSQKINSKSSNKIGLIILDLTQKPHLLKPYIELLLSHKPSHNTPIIGIKHFSKKLNRDTLSIASNLKITTALPKLGALTSAIAEILETSHVLAKQNSKFNKSASADLRPLRILLAEDQEDNQFVISHYLKDLPYELDFAANGDEAIAKAKTYIYDLILMDLQMPIKDGYSATREIRSLEEATKRPGIPIIALTAHALIEEQKKALNSGCSKVLTKPIKRDTLLQALRDIVTTL